MLPGSRRGFLIAAGTLAGISLTGCLQTEVDGDLAVDDRVWDDGDSYSFSVAEGIQINVFISTRKGPGTEITLVGPDEVTLLEETVETEDTFSQTAQTGGTHVLTVMPTGDDGEAVVQVGVER